MRPLLVIPARGGSVGIPRKAVRRLNGASPLEYTIRTAKQVSDRVAVVTDDAEIAAQAVAAGALVVSEPILPTAPGVHTWAPVVFRAVQMIESRAEWEGPYEAVAVLQCTSPFLRPTTVQRCVDALAASGIALTVADDRHARIGTPRVTRQQMAPCWKVTGGCTAIRRELLADTEWPVDTHGTPIVVEGAEAVDLDTPEDWAVAEMYAGVTERELYLAQVLIPDTAHGPPVVLSAWDEVAGEQARRFAAAGKLGTPVSYDGTNTHDEAVRAIENRSGDDLTLVTSAYHMPRAFLTFLRVLEEQHLDRQVRLWHVPVPSPMTTLAEEWHKIRDYQEKGHVATIENGLRYLHWRDTTVGPWGIELDR